MELKEAKLNLKEYTSNSKKIKPILSDDWTIKFYKLNSERILFSSKKEEAEILLYMDISVFFDKFVFTKKINIDGDKAKGSFSVGKYRIIMEDEYLESIKVITVNNMEAIPNHLLIEDVLYTEKNGETFTYMGEREIYLLRRNTFEIKKKNKYMIKTEGFTDIEKGTKFQLKSSAKKLIKVKKVFSVIERDLFDISLAKELYNSGISILGKKDFKKVKEISIEETMSGTLIKYKEEYYLTNYKRKFLGYNSGFRVDKSKYELLKINIEEIKKDVKSGVINEINYYLSKEKLTISLSEKEKEKFMILFLE